MSIRQGAEVASFALDPGESAEATESANGVVSITVHPGTVTVTTDGETVDVRPGQSQVIDVCTPLAIETLTRDSWRVWPAGTSLYGHDAV